MTRCALEGPHSCLAEGDKYHQDPPLAHDSQRRSCDRAKHALQDAVVRSGKFVILYKRPGHRVLINAAGDLIVRPSYVESSVRQRPGQHL